MDNGLKPCPFCGAKAEIVVYDPEESWDYRMEIEHDESCWLASSRPSVRNYYTKAEAEAAWNTRAQTVFGMTLDEVRQMMKRDAEQAERTCHLIEHGKFMPEHEFYRVECSMCGVMFWQTKGRFPRANYCPNCGRRVE